MQASVFFPELQYFKSLKSIFLNVYNSAEKLGFLKCIVIIQRCRKISDSEAVVLRQKANSPAGVWGDADENLRIVLHKITGNFTFVSTLMILMKQYNDHI